MGIPIVPGSRFSGMNKSALCKGHLPHAAVLFDNGYRIQPYRKWLLW